MEKKEQSIFEKRNSDAGQLLYCYHKLNKRPEDIWKIIFIV